ncbi:MAG TPA: SGNH/GDSL hydrolase family protein [Stellaceae bacterium]|nr:SGNH/GDSL hydrolase family protein [Stellaceae bacterium]
MAALLAATLAAQGAAAAPPDCAVPPGLAALGAPLAHTARRLDQGGVLRIVALGSSSTAGFGASSAAMSYPSRLQQELASRLPGIAPGISVMVLNRGVGGQRVGEEVARLGRDVIAAHPDLVIWQVGTNAVLRRDDFTADAAMIRRGVAAIKASGSDVVLMDLQYAPRVLARPSYQKMEQLIAAAARDLRVGLFRRFAVMARWAETGQLAPAPIVAPDGLHMTDASYGCLAADLAEAIAGNAEQRVRRAALRPEGAGALLPAARNGVQTR